MTLMGNSRAEARLLTVPYTVSPTFLTWISLGSVLGPDTSNTPSLVTE